MKKKLHLKLFSLFVLLTSLVSAQSFTIGNLKYEVISGKNVSVKTTTLKISGSLIISSTVTNAGIVYTVTNISDDAFSQCSGLTSVTISNSVTSIGVSAFYECSGLTSLTIPNSVANIGESAFYNCSGLTSLIIPNSLTKIKNYTFVGCSGLTSIIIPNSVISIGESAFYDCSGLTSIIIPNSVTSLGDYYTFAFCTGLKSVTIPNSLTSINNYTFYNCIGLTSVIIPVSVTNIGNQAFYGCSGLTAVTIPDAVTSVGDFAFRGCSKLTAVNVSWAIPLVINSNVFAGVNINTISLNVSAPGSVSDYKTVAVWKDFGSITLDTNSYQANSTVKLYPNPAKNYISISGSLENENYLIYNAVGAKINAGSVSSNEKIDIQNLAKGVYFLKVNQGNAIKFIKE